MRGAGVYDLVGVEWGGVGAAEADGALGEAVEGVDAGGGDVPDEEMIVGVGGEAHGVDLLGFGGIGAGDGAFALGGCHVDVLWPTV